MKKKNNATSRRFCVTGYEQRTLPTVPADFMFDQLVDVQAFGEAVDDIVCFERYDPTVKKMMMKKKKKPTSSANRNGGSSSSIMKEHQDMKERVVVFRKNQATQQIEKPTPVEFAKPGYCYFQTRCSHGKTEHITTSFTRVDKEFDEATGKRGLITVCNYRGCAFTSTYEIEKLVGTGGCRYNLSWAMVPDGWYGQAYFLLQYRQIKRHVPTLVNEEIEQVMRATETKYHKLHSASTVTSHHHGSPPSSTSSLVPGASANTTATTTSNVSTTT